MRTHQYAHKKRASQSSHTLVPRPSEVQSSVKSQPIQAKSNEEGLAEHAERLRKFQRLGNSMIQMGPPRPCNDKTSSLQPKPWIQRKLTLGQPGDKYEQEADRVASQVVQQINAPTPEENNLRQSIQHEKESEGEMQAKCFNAAIQRQQAIAGGEALPDLESAIDRARGSGQPLDAGLQQSMGQVMGADFSGVRVHTDAQSNRLNQSIQARAFTTGQDVFFREGAYQPTSRGGQELIAHELTHVVQQGGKEVGVASEESGNSLSMKEVKERFIQRLFNMTREENEGNVFYKIRRERVSGSNEYLIGKTEGKHVSADVTKEWWFGTKKEWTLVEIVARIKHLKDRLITEQFGEGLVGLIGEPKKYEKLTSSIEEIDNLAIKSEENKNTLKNKIKKRDEIDEFLRRREKFNNLKVFVKGELDFLKELDENDLEKHQLKIQELINKFDQLYDLMPLINLYSKNEKGGGEGALMTKIEANVTPLEWVGLFDEKALEWLNGCNSIKDIQIYLPYVGAEPIKELEGDDEEKKVEKLSEVLMGMMIYRHIGMVEVYIGNIKETTKKYIADQIIDKASLVLSGTTEEIIEKGWGGVPNEFKKTLNENKENIDKIIQGKINERLKKKKRERPAFGSMVEVEDMTEEQKNKKIKVEDDSFSNEDNSSSDEDYN